jgi:N-acetylglutamate synthase-like GNAT family acetyltransferase
MATPVRAATREDLPEILRIVNLAYRVEDFFIAGDRIDLPQLRARFEQPGAELLVIDAPEPARLVAAVHFEDRGDHGWFGLLAVDPAAQGAGHARTLIHAMEDRCRALGLTSLMIEVVDLRTELPPFYARLGFVDVATKPFHDTHKLKRPAALRVMRKWVNGEK